MSKFTLILSVILGITIQTYAQKTITGQIIDQNGNPLSGVIIKIKNYNLSASTNQDGFFKLILPTDTTKPIFTSTAGYKIKNIKPASDSFFIITVETKPELDIFNLSAMQLMNIKVYTTNKTVENIIESPGSIDILTRRDIDILNFNSLNDIMEYAPGISAINGEGNIFTTLTIRGNTQVNYNTNTLLLFDGIPLYNPYNGSFNLNDIPLSAIERIEIVNGSNSVLYGSNALNGVINIIPKHLASDTATTTGKIRYGSFNTTYSNITLMQRKNNYYLYFFNDAQISDGEPLTYNDEAGHQLTLRKKYSGINNILKIGNSHLSLTLKYSNHSEPGVKTRGFQIAPTFPGDTLGSPVPEQNNEQSFMANVKYTRRLSKISRINLSSTIYYWKLNKYFVNGQWNYSSIGSYNDIFLNNNFSSRLTNITGISYNHYIGRRYKTQIQDYDIGKLNIWTDDISFYINGKYTPWQQLMFFYGYRIYFARYGKTQYHNFSPRISIVLTPNKKIFFKAIYGESFRIPTYFEKEVHSDKVIGNPYLKPEKSRSVDIVLTGKSKIIYFSSDLYYEEIYNKIERVISPDDPEKRINLNVGNIILYGLETNTKIKFSDNIYGFATYTYNMGDNKDTNGPILYIYKHMFTIGGEVLPLPYLRIYFSGKYLSKWGTAPAYTIVNGGITVTPTKKLPVAIDISADNIFDTDVYLPEIARRSPQVPVIPKTTHRKIFLGIQYRF